MSGVASQPTSRRIQLRANTKMELMKQQVEQEKLRRCAKPFPASMPFTRQSAAAESFPECHMKVCISCVHFLCMTLCNALAMLFVLSAV